eukprot:scaffold1277_cov253-Pinguiococcus_pyrenoidosus.AAC.32
MVTCDAVAPPARAEAPRSWQMCPQPQALQEQAEQAFAPPHCVNPSGPVIFLDWDDTVLPTSWLSHKSQRGRPLSSIRCELLPVAACFQDLLEECHRQAFRLIIVTNADEHWVQETCSMFLPSVLHNFARPEVQDVIPRTSKSLSVVSARAEFEQLGEDPTTWKTAAFLSELYRLVQERDAKPSAAFDELSLESSGSMEEEFFKGGVGVRSEEKVGTSDSWRRTGCARPRCHNMDKSETEDTLRSFENAVLASAIPVCSQMLSIGDSDYEAEACVEVATRAGLLCKTMRMGAKGTPTMIAKQLDMVTRSLTRFLALREQTHVDVDV